MITLIIVIFTSAISILAFRIPGLFGRLELSPYRIIHKKEYYRIFTHAFLHADYVHLIINMLVLYSFGRAVESVFRELEMSDIIFSSHFFYLLLYITSILLSTISTVWKERNNSQYIAVGASGAVSAVVFTYIFFAPLQKIYFYMVLPIPGIIFGILYLIYSSVMSRKGKDNINHAAHFWGAVFGFLFPVILDPSLVENFWRAIF